MQLHRVICAANLAAQNSGFPIAFWPGDRSQIDRLNLLNGEHKSVKNLTGVLTFLCCIHCPQNINIRMTFWILSYSALYCIPLLYYLIMVSSLILSDDGTSCVELTSVSRSHAQQYNRLPLVGVWRILHLTNHFSSAYPFEGQLLQAV